jgi:hypothetical protein
MAYKYKLVKEIETSTLEDIGTFIKSVTIQPGNIALEALRKIFVEIPSSNNPNDEINTLDSGIRDILSNDGGFGEEDIEEYMQYLYGLRKNTVTPSGVPINEKEEDFMKTASSLAQKGNLDRNKKQDKYNQTKGNTPMTDKERNMTPEEYREYREREKLEEQGKKNLTKEVLRRLKNH